MQETSPNSVFPGLKNQCRGGVQTAAAVTALSAAIAEGKSVAELNLLAIAFNMLGDALGVIAAQRAFCETQGPG